MDARTGKILKLQHEDKVTRDFPSFPSPELTLAQMTARQLPSTSLLRLPIHGAGVATRRRSANATTSKTTTPTTTTTGTTSTAPPRLPRAATMPQPRATTLLLLRIARPPTVLHPTPPPLTATGPPRTTTVAAAGTKTLILKIKQQCHLLIMMTIKFTKKFMVPGMRRSHQSRLFQRGNRERSTTLDSLPVLNRP